MAKVNLRLHDLQDLAHRRLRDIIVKFDIDVLYVTYDETSATFWVSDDGVEHEVMAQLYTAVNDYENVYFKTFKEGKSKLPSDSLLCFREGVWYN